MGSANRRSDAPSLSLRIENWSAVLDALRRSVAVLKRRPELLDEPRAAVAGLYRSLGGRVEARVDVGDPWDRVVTVPLSEEEADLLTAVLAAVEPFDVGDGRDAGRSPDPDPASDAADPHGLG